MKSEFLKLNMKDIGKGFIVAVITSIIASIQPIISTGAIPDLEKLKSIGIIGLSAGLAYLVKNYFTNSDDQMMKK